MRERGKMRKWIKGSLEHLLEVIGENTTDNYNKYQWATLLY